MNVSGNNVKSFDHDKQPIMEENSTTGSRSGIIKNLCASRSYVPPPWE